MEEMADFWEYLDRLAASSQRVIDRPAGSVHPRYPELVYPLDYGYLEGTTTVDGGGIDFWSGSSPELGLDAVALTVDLYKGDAELKLLFGCSEAEKQVIMDFQNGGSMRACLVRRGGNLEFLRSRQSVRRFRPEPVPQAVLDLLLETAVRAPSAHNAQPWRFVVLGSPESRQRLAHEMGLQFYSDLLADGLAVEDAKAQVNRSRQRILQAPAAILLCQDASVGDTYPDSLRQQAETLSGVQGVALAGGYLLLAAHALGLGAVWMCAPLFAPQAARRALNLPDSWQPQALLLVGYPAKVPPPRPRRPVQEITLVI